MEPTRRLYFPGSHSAPNARFEAPYSVLFARNQLWPVSTRILSSEGGAGDGLRTRYLDLGKVALYQVSYSRSARGKIIPWPVWRSGRAWRPAVHEARAPFIS